MSLPRLHRRSLAAASLYAAAAYAAAALLVACSDDEPGSCTGTNDCSQGRACVQSVCQEVTCTDNLECPNDAICYREEGLCGRLECRIDAECTDRRLPFCADSRCVAQAPPECTNRSRCDSGQACVQGSCAAVGEGATCDDSEDCGNPQICDPDRGEAGQCVDPCRAADGSDCDQTDGLRACDVETGRCITVDCLTEGDCEDDEECNDAHVCVLQRFDCDTLSCFDQPGRPFMTEPDPIDGLCRCVQCLDTSHCSTSNQEVCTDSKRCVFCATTAAGPNDCTDERPYFREGCCAECLDDEGCQHLGLGSTCGNGRCVICNCNGACECPGTSDCETQDDGTGRCIAALGELGDPCVRQADCGEDLACSYALGECVQKGSGSFCTLSGCPEPTRCASAAGGSLCYGCHPPEGDGDEEECPEGQQCIVSPDWEGVYDGGQCLPG